MYKAIRRLRRHYRFDTNVQSLLINNMRKRIFKGARDYLL
jgi:hypothetical protein